MFMLIFLVLWSLYNYAKPSISREVAISDCSYYYYPDFHIHPHIITPAPEDQYKMQLIKSLPLMTPVLLDPTCHQVRQRLVRVRSHVLRGEFLPRELHRR